MVNSAEYPGWLRGLHPGAPVRVVINGTLQDVLEGGLFISASNPDAPGPILEIKYGEGSMLRVLASDTSVTVTPLVPAGGDSHGNSEQA